MNSSNSWRVVCEAEAKPKPNITWLNPKGLPINGTKITSSTNRQSKFPNSISVYNIISFFNITEEHPEGKYTCLVENKYGQENDHVIFITAPPPQSNTTSQWIVVGCSIALGLVLLLLFAVGLHIYKKKRNHSQEQRGRSNYLCHSLHQDERNASFCCPGTIREHLHLCCC
uniref:Ig-like domain-containing protein n=1 Tax=Eptatretus burgeri TaxID=7764 RepID=A0A8C4Q3W3_EPTBU